MFRAGIITASDRATRAEREDASGPRLRTMLEESHFSVVAYEVVPDDRGLLKKALLGMADEMACDLILTTGGTGLGPRDVTPEATREILEREIPGIQEIIRHESAKKTPYAMLSRALAGVRGETLIVNLPGSPDGALEAFQILRPVLSHALLLLKGQVKDCQKPSPSLRSHS